MIGKDMQVYIRVERSKFLVSEPEHKVGPVPLLGGVGVAGQEYSPTNQPHH